MRYWLVMPAAGSGRRFAGDGLKQYAPLDGRTVIEWALAPFLADARCAHIVVALAPDDRDWKPIEARLGAAAGPSADGVQRITGVGGGAQRSHSVRLALAALEGLAGPDDWVLVHDAARPCLDAQDLERLLGRLGAHPLGGLLATPVADTLKRAQAGAGTGSGVAQTLEWLGERPVLIEGAATNLKITSAEDLVLAAAVLRARRA